MKKLFIIILIFYSRSLKSQSNYSHIWMQGVNKLFKSTFYSTGVVNDFLIQDSTYLKYFHHGNSSICDVNGNLTLISGGYHIYDTLLNLIEGGDSLVPVGIYLDENGWSGYSQTSMFLPMDSNQYYFITPTVTDTTHTKWYLPTATEAPFDLLWYNKIDMNANGGLGKVVKRKMPLLENVRLSKTGMMACRHANGKDWWMAKPALDTNMIYLFRFTQDSIYLDTVQGFAEPHFGFWDTDGQTMFDQEGTKYASTYRHSKAIFLADFDRCYGRFSNPQIIYTPHEKTHNPFDSTQVDSVNINEGLAFSPDGNLLYVSSDYNIWQYELNNPDSSTAWYHVAGLDTTWATFQGYSNMYLGNDNKLYIGNWAGLSKQMSVIDSPNNKGASCSFCPRCFRFPGIAAGTPPCMPNYDLGAKTCWPDGVAEARAESGERLEVWPNPACNKLSVISNQKSGIKELCNSIGQLILTTKKNEIDVSTLPSGIYYLRCGYESVKVVVE